MAAVPAHIDADSVQKLFPQVVADSGTVYLDSAATTLKPKPVVDALDRFYRQQYATVHRGMYPLALRATDEYMAARRKIQSFINASQSSEIIFTRGCTEAINMVARAFGDKYLTPGDEIVITESEHHSNLVPWQMLSQRKKCPLRVIPIKDNGHLDLSALPSLLTPRTKIVAVQHKSNVTGITHPVEEITKAAHSVGAKVLVDAAQSCQDIDVQKLGADFVAFSGHKMYGPTGIGVLYGKQEALESLPPWQGGGDMVDRVEFGRTTFSSLPQRLEAGTPPIAEAIGLGVAVDFIEKLGRGKLQKYINSLGDYARRQLAKIPGVKLLPSEGSVIAFNHTSCSALDTATLLGASGFSVRAGHHCCQPLHRRLGVPSSLRISFAPHNTRSDIDKFTKALSEVLGQLKKNEVVAVEKSEVKTKASTSSGGL